MTPSDITIGTLQPFVRRKYTFTGADTFGAIGAHHDFTEAIRKYGRVRGVHVFGMSSIADEAIRDLDRSSFNAFSGSQQPVISTKRLRELPALTSQYSYVFLEAGEHSLQLAYHRSMTGLSFPICSLLHSVRGPFFPHIYRDILFNFRPEDRIVATSSAGKKAILRIFEAARSGLENVLTPTASKYINEGSRVEMIPLGVDSDWFQSYNQALSRKLLGLPQDCPVILYLGRLSEHFKGDLEPLLLAVKKILSRHTDCMLILAGHDINNEYSPKLRGLAGALGIAHQVSIVSNFAPALKPVLYSAASIFVSPVDNIQETFGLSVLEAMACGLPVVAPDWSGYRDLIEHGVTGFLIPSLWSEEAGVAMSTYGMLMPSTTPEGYLAQRTAIDVGALYRSLSALVENNDLARQFGFAGRQRVTERYDWKMVLRSYESLWMGQQEISKRCASVPVLTRMSPVEWNNVFSCYASMSLSHDTLLEVGDDLTGDIPLLRRSEDLELVRRACLESPRTAGYLSTLVPGGMDTVMHAVKKGVVMLTKEVTSENVTAMEQQKGAVTVLPPRSS